MCSVNHSQCDMVRGSVTGTEKAMAGVWRCRQRGITHSCYSVAALICPFSLPTQNIQSERYTATETLFNLS